MSEIIANAQRSSEITQTNSLKPLQRVGPALESLSGLMLSDLNRPVKEEVEALLVVVNQILSVYEITDQAGYEKLSDSDAQNVLSRIGEVNQLCIDAEAGRVMHELETAGRKLPVDAIKEVRQHPDIFAPLLIRSLKQAVLRVRNGDKLDDGTPFFAVFLLTELKVHEAFPVLLEVLRLPDEGTFEVLGDGVHELVAPILALFSRGDPKVISNIVQDLDIDMYVRWSAAKTYLYLVRDELISRELAIGALQEDFDYCLEKEDFKMLAPIVCELGDLAAESSLEDIRSAYQRNLVDESIVDLAFIESQIAGGEETVNRELEYCRPTGMPDTIAELSRWAAFREEPPRPPKVNPAPRAIPRPHLSTSMSSEPSDFATTVRSGQKVGRNDACPCGSGKKFKRCCR